SSVALARPPVAPGAECVWMDTFPGCSLIDASVDARGLMHSHSQLALPANPACRLFLSHTDGHTVHEPLVHTSSHSEPAKHRQLSMLGVQPEGVPDV
ncbi:hypothetical protein JOQ06_014420, partial [Pogonophryne albipinna]